MPLGEMSLGLVKLNGPQHPLVSVLNVSQSKRPSAQSTKGMESPIVRDAVGMESPIVRKPKARAHLCELKSRRSPKRSPFVRKDEGMESPIVHNAEVVLIYLENIFLSSKMMQALQVYKLTSLE